MVLGPRADEAGTVERGAHPRGDFEGRGEIYSSTSENNESKTGLGANKPPCSEDQARIATRLLVVEHRTPTPCVHVRVPLSHGSVASVLGSAKGDGTGDEWSVGASSVVVRANAILYSSTEKWLCPAW